MISIESKLELMLYMLIIIFIKLIKLSRHRTNWKAVRLVKSLGSEKDTETPELPVNVI